MSNFFKLNFDFTDRHVGVIHARVGVLNRDSKNAPKAHFISNRQLSQIHLLSAVEVLQRDFELCTVVI